MARRTYAETSSPIRARLLPALALVLGLGLFLLVIVAIARGTRAGLRQSERFSVAFADIDCPAPPSLDRSGFLAEVQYLCGLPDRLSVLDNDLPVHLADAFARHPWVEQVYGVTLAPPRHIEVRLTFRTPVLEVFFAETAVPEDLDPLDETAVDGQSWVVDKRGAVLPGNGFHAALPMFFARIRATGPAGQDYGDSAVEAAARIADALHPQQAKFKLRVFEKTRQGFVLKTSAGSRILWGQPPGREVDDEVPAARKIERLLQYCEAHGDLDNPAGPYEHDVRPRDGARHGSLPPRKSPRP